MKVLEPYNAQIEKIRADHAEVQRKAQEEVVLKEKEEKKAKKRAEEEAALKKKQARDAAVAAHRAEVEEIREFLENVAQERQAVWQQRI